MSTSDPSSGAYEDPLPGPTWTWFAAGSVVVVALSIGVAALLYDMQDRRTASSRTATPVSALEDYRNEQAARLNGPIRRELRLEHPDQPVVVIPIEQAMKAIADGG